MSEEKKVEAKVEEAPVDEAVLQPIEALPVDETEVAGGAEEIALKGKRAVMKTVEKTGFSRGRARRDDDVKEWVPKTQLGKMVKSGGIKSFADVLATGLPIREPEIADHFFGESLTDEVLKVNMVQRMTDSGRRTRFSITVVVGNGNGYVGLGSAKGKEVGPAIKKAIDNAKLNMVQLTRGCGSWECGCMQPHTLPYKVVGKSGSTEITLRPAPQGVGLAVGDVPKKILKLAGIKDAWGFSRGQTKTTVNNAKAVMDALQKITQVKVQPSDRIELRHMTGAAGPVNPVPQAGEEK
jgi:small subunit ribosomal protein S5